MKKRVVINAVIGLILMLLGVAGTLFLGNLLLIDGAPLYTMDQYFGNIGAIVTAEFTNLQPMGFVTLGLVAVLLVFLIVQIAMAAKKKHGAAAGVSIATVLAMALVFAFMTFSFLPGVTANLVGGTTYGYAVNGLGLFAVVVAALQAQKWLALVFFAPALLFLIGFILFLVALFSDMKLLSDLPKPNLDELPEDNVVVINDEDLESEESAQAAQKALSEGGYAERHAASVTPAPAAPAVQGPFLIQYINTYAPAESASASQAPGKKNTVPVTEIQGAITGEKPLTPDEIRKIIREELGEKKDQPVIVNVPAAPKPEEKQPGLTAEEVRSIVSEEMGRFLSTEEEEPQESEIFVEEDPGPALTADDIRQIVAETLAKQAAPAPAKEEPKPEPVDVRSLLREELEAQRQRAAEEEEKKAAEEAARKAHEEEIQKAREEARKAAEEEANKDKTLTADDIRALLAEFKKEMEGEPKKEPELTLDVIREVVRAELRDNAPVKEDKVQPVTVVVKESDIVRPAPEPAKEEPKPEPVAPIVNIIVKSPETPAEPEPEPEPEPEAEEEEEAPVRVVGQVNPDLPPHDKIIRIPFPTRMVDADKELKSNYNELKSEIMSYGVKSRVSNSGDTFRLHKVTFVKITIAGKGLKLYFALDPKDYASSTLPVQDAGHKGTYRDIPLVFKVKSDLSVRRAKQLIADVMEKNGLEQGKIEPHNWADELKDYKPTGSDKDDD